jgi:hypothetical protein
MWVSAPTCLVTFLSSIPNVLTRAHHVNTVSSVSPCYVDCTRLSPLRLKSRLVFLPALDQLVVSDGFTFGFLIDLGFG